MISLKASILFSGSSGFRPWNTISTLERISRTFSTRVASVKSFPIPSTASTEKRGTSTCESSKPYSRRIAILPWRRVPRCREHSPGQRSGILVAALARGDLAEPLYELVPADDALLHQELREGAQDD